MLFGKKVGEQQKRSNYKEDQFHKVESIVPEAKGNYNEIGELY